MNSSDFAANQSYEHSMTVQTSKQVFHEQSDNTMAPRTLLGSKFLQAFAKDQSKDQSYATENTFWQQSAEPTDQNMHEQDLELTETFISGYQKFLEQSDSDDEGIPCLDLFA